MIGEQGIAKAASSRKLSTHQKAVLIQVLLTFPGEPVGICASNDTDARSYAEDFLTVFKSVGWNIDAVEPLAEAVSPAGLALFLPQENPPPSAEALRDALLIYGIEMQRAPNDPQRCGSRSFVLAVSSISADMAKPNEP